MDDYNTNKPESFFDEIRGYIAVGVLLAIFAGLMILLNLGYDFIAAWFAGL